MKLYITVLFIFTLLCDHSNFAVCPVAPPAEIPFELKSNYIIFQVPSERFGTLRLLLDTGCQTTVINTEIIGEKDQNLPLTLLLGEQKLLIKKYHLRPRSTPPKAIGPEIDGVIGNDIFHNFIVKLDFSQKRLLIFDKDTIISNPQGEDIPLTVNPLVSSMRLKLVFPDAKELEGEFVIDTGAPITVILNSPVAKQHGIQADASKNREFKTQAAVQTAVEVKTRTIQVGQTQLQDLPVYISTSDKGLFAVTKYAGMVGTGLLRNFNVIFDYSGNRLSLEKLR
jgi:hypothetical protein